MNKAAHNQCLKKLATKIAKVCCDSPLLLIIKLKHTHFCYRYRVIGWDSFAPPPLILLMKVKHAFCSQKKRNKHDYVASGGSGSNWHQRVNKSPQEIHNQSGTSAGFWLRGSMPPCRLRRRKFWKFDCEMVHSEVYLNKYVVSIAAFSTPTCPDCCQNLTYTKKTAPSLHVFAF